MNRRDPKRAEPLLSGVSQFEVDFVIPRIGIDVPVGIDPFLLFKSRDPEFQALHTQILDVFRAALEMIRKQQNDEVQRLLEFPEVSEVGLGYTRQGKRGSGVGMFLSQLILDTLRDSPALLERGVRHIEELQLVSVGIGPDRISDITASLMKEFLVQYTQKQCAIWNIPMAKGVPVAHIFDHDAYDWIDGHFDLPVSRVDNSPILLVPRRIVRALPWINYDDFVKLEFAVYLRARAAKRRKSSKQVESEAAMKRDVVAVTRREIERVDRYVRVKEETAVKAQPSTGFVDYTGFQAEADELKAKLKAVLIGRDDAAKYQQTILEILNFLFNPELIDGELEVRTVEGTERRDIIFTNDSDITFWDYVRSEHSGVFLMFETKNAEDLNPPALNQTGTYLGDRLGRLGFIVTRNKPSDSAMKKAFSIYNDSTPRKIILFLSDQDIEHMLDQKVAGNNPTKHIQNLYRKFRTSVQ
jgi:hypothetical protein